MVAKNDITGDAIKSRTNSKEYGDRYRLPAPTFMVQS